MNINNYNQLVESDEKSIDNQKISSNLFEVIDSAKLESSKCSDEDNVKGNLLNLSDIHKKSEVPNIALSTFKLTPSIDHRNNENEFVLPLPQDSVKFFNDKTISGIDITQNSSSPSNETDLLSKHVFDKLFNTKNATDLLDMNCDPERYSEDVLTLKQFHFQFNQSQNKISDLENLALTQNNDLNYKFIQEIDCLKEQIQMYLETTNILITEKANLNKSVSHYRSLIEKKTQIIEALNQEFNLSEYRCSEIQKNLQQMQRIVCEIEESHKILQLNHENLNQKCLELQKCNEEQKLDIAELQQSLNLKNIDLKRFSQKVQENNKLLVLAELKLQQLTNKSHNPNLLEDQNKIHTVFEEQSSKLHEHLNTFNAEKSDIINHYENYIKQLINKCEGMSKDLQKSQTIIENLKEREENLNKQHQQEKQKTKSIFSQETNENQKEYFTEKINSLLQTQESILNTLSEKETEIEILTKELTELHELKNQSIEVSKLMSSLESEQLGASRAISQNQQLKEQLSKMQTEILTLTNTKLNLTQQLQNEMKKNEELNSQLNSLVSRNDRVQHEMNEKIAVINKMEIETSQLKSEVYQTQSDYLINLYEKGQHTLDLEKMYKCTSQELNFSDETSTVIANKNSNIRSNKSNNGDNNYCLTAETGTENFEEFGKTQSHMLDLMTEPTKKLEIRFKEMMEKVAELTDEKQRLEHLVLQLQGETETIGEYITLYHRQRSTLQRKAQENEKTFRHLIEQYNQQHTQLCQLKVLLADLMKVSDTSLPSNQNNMASSGLYHKNIPDAVTEKFQIDQLDQLMFNKKSETTEKIMYLMKDIIDSQDPCTIEQNFHPCLWCSGKLITV